jgi:alanyl-tRNA synthetase
MIAVRHWERAKGLTRIEFVAGVRALADYRRANKTARAVAALYSSARDDAAKLTSRVLEENKELHRRVRALEEIAASAEAEELLRVNSTTTEDQARGSSPTLREGVGAGPRSVDETATNQSRLRVITKVFDNRDAESLKHLAQALISHPQTVALLGSREKGAARLVFARSVDASGDMNALMKTACEILDGRGGGRPDMAQGGGQNVERLDEALGVAKETFE